MDPLTILLWMLAIGVGLYVVWFLIVAVGIGLLVSEFFEPKPRKNAPRADFTYRGRL